MSVSDWGGPGDADSPGRQADAGTEAQGAADKRLRELNLRVGLEATRIAETRRGRQYVRHGLTLRDFATTGTSPNLATDELQFAKQVIDNLTASIDAGGPGGAPAHAYPAERRELAIGALQALDLPGLLNLAGLYDDLRALSDYDYLGEILTGLRSPATDGQVAEARLLLRNIDNAISSLLADDGDRDGRWLSTARALLEIAARFIVAAGIALVVAAGSMLSVGQTPVVGDDLKAVTAFALGAGCTLLQRDLPALWTQPDLSAHLRVADRMLRASVADLATACRDGSPGQVRTDVFAAGKAAYLAGCLAAAAQDWRQRDRYVSVAEDLQVTCRRISQLDNPAALRKLAGTLTRSADRLKPFELPDKLALRPEARLELPGRLRALAAPLGQLDLPIRGYVNIRVRS